MGADALIGEIRVRDKKVGSRGFSFFYTVIL
jgi:hypothetical protein